MYWIYYGVVWEKNCRKICMVSSFTALLCYLTTRAHCPRAKWTVECSQHFELPSLWCVFPLAAEARGLICIEFVNLYFPVLFCLSVSVKWLAVKTASEMTYTVSSGALNSSPTNQPTGLPSTVCQSVLTDCCLSCLHLSPSSLWSLSVCLCVYWSVCLCVCLSSGCSVYPTQFRKWTCLEWMFAVRVLAPFTSYSAVLWWK